MRMASTRPQPDARYPTPIRPNRAAQFARAVRDERRGAARSRSSQRDRLAARALQQLRDRAPDRRRAASAGRTGACRRNRRGRAARRSRSAISKPSVVSVSAFEPRARLVGSAATGTAARSTTGARRGRRGRAAGAAATGRSARRARRPSRVAFGTSTPTSTTVVDTSMCELAARERLHHAVLRVRLQPAVQQRRRDTPGNTSCARWSAISVAAFRSTFSDSSTSG